MTNLATDWLKDPAKRGRVVLAVAALLLLTLLWPLAVSRDARHLSAYDSDAEDLSRFRSEATAVGARIESLAATPHALADLEDPQKAVLVVVGPERRYDPGEARAVVAFLRAGGTVILADETGFGSDVAKEAGYAFSPAPLLDTQNYRGDPRLVVTTATLGGQAYKLLLNAPALLVALRSPNPADTLAASSGAKYPDGSYVDTNDNGEIDIADQPGPFPLILETTVGEGTLVLVADTGLFMNAQMGVPEYDNAAFARALLQTHASADGVIVIDESRHAPNALAAPWANAVRSVGRATSGAVAPFVLVGLLALATVAAWRLTRKTEDWSHHDFDLSQEILAPESVRPDLARAQRMARHAVSEKYNIPMEQVSAMTTEELLALTGDRTLAEAASGALKSDPTPFFSSLGSKRPTPQEGSTP